MVKTDSKSTAIISFPDGAGVTLKPNSEWYYRTPDHFELSLGNMYARFQKLLSKRYTIRTPTAVAAVRGTEITISIDSNNSTKLSVLEGEVEIRDVISNSTVIVTGNQTIEVPQVPGGLTEQEMMEKVTTFDQTSIDRWWEAAKPAKPLVTGGDVEWLPDLDLNYTHAWPMDSSSWNHMGIGMYELTANVEDEIYIDFTFTYMVLEDIQIKVEIINKMPFGLFGGSGVSNGLLHQFDFVDPPTSNIGEMRFIDEDPIAGAGYELSQPMNIGDQLIIKGRLKMVNQTAINLYTHGLANTTQYSNSYLPIADVITIGDQFLVPGLDIWGALGIRLPESVVDTVQTMKYFMELADQEIEQLQTQISDIQNNLTVSQGQVKALQSDLKLAQDQIKSAENSATLSVDMNKQDFLPGEEVLVTGKLLSGSTPVEGNLVALTVMGPEGVIVSRTAITGSEGEFILGFRLSSEAQSGTHQVQASTSYQSQVATAESTFTMSQSTSVNTLTTMTITQTKTETLTSEVPVLDNPALIGGLIAAIVAMIAIAFFLGKRK